MKEESFQSYTPLAKKQSAIFGETDEFILKTSTNNYGAFKFYGVSGNDNLSLLFHTNNIKLYANGQAVHIGVNINDGNWHHFVRTSDRSTGQEKVYLDGALAFTGNIRMEVLSLKEDH